MRADSASLERSIATASIDCNRGCRDIFQWHQPTPHLILVALGNTRGIATKGRGHKGERVRKMFRPVGILTRPWTRSRSATARVLAVAALVGIASIAFVAAAPPAAASNCPYPGGADLPDCINPNAYWECGGASTIRSVDTLIGVLELRYRGVLCASGWARIITASSFSMLWTARGNGAYTGDTLGLTYKSGNSNWSGTLHRPSANTLKAFLLRDIWHAPDATAWG